MRSKVAAPGWLKFYSEYLQEAGFYTTNNAKTDYNLEKLPLGWDDSSRTAHWRNRPEGKPFFSVFNLNVSHESKIRSPNPTLKHDPSTVPIPPYMPDIPEVRDNWAQYYDRLTDVDNTLKLYLDQLEEDGLVDDTIVFFYADHGSGMPRGKRYPGWSGLHVPFIVSVPEKFAHLAPNGYRAGSRSDRLIGFVDLAPTVLSIIGVDIPDTMHGRPFMGKESTEAPKYSYGFRGRMDERPDECRSLTDGRYIYIRNFMPLKPHGQHVNYQFQTQTTAKWKTLYDAGELNPIQSAFWEPHPAEELFDLENDPYETINLAASPDHQDTLKNLRAELKRHMLKTRDLIFLPEPLLKSQETQVPSLADYGKSDSYPIEKLFELASLQLNGSLPEKKLVPYFSDSNPAVRYWASVVLRVFPNETVSHYRDELEKLLDDSTPIVAIAAAETLTRKSDSQNRKAVDTLLSYASVDENGLYNFIHATNALEAIAHKTPRIAVELAKKPKQSSTPPQWARNYAPRLLEQFGIEP